MLKRTTSNIPVLSYAVDGAPGELRVGEWPPGRAALSAVSKDISPSAPVLPSAHLPHSHRYTCVRIHTRIPEATLMCRNTFLRIRPRLQDSLRGLLPQPRRRDGPGADHDAHMGAPRAGARPALQAPADALQQHGETRVLVFLLCLSIPISPILSFSSFLISFFLPSSLSCL